MTYELIEGSEVNCYVDLETGGTVEIIPLDPKIAYGFNYYQIETSGAKNFCTWHSHLEHTQNELIRYAYYDEDFPDDDLDYFDIKYDSNV